VSAKPTPLVPKLATKPQINDLIEKSMNEDKFVKGIDMNLSNPNKGSKRYDDRIVEMDLADYLNVFHKEEPKKEVVVVQ
jgi:hypothetical protein